MEPRSGYIMQLEPPTHPTSPTDQFEISFDLAHSTWISSVALPAQLVGIIFVGRLRSLFVGWVGDFMTITPRYGSILQVGPCQIFSLAENPR